MNGDDNITHLVDMHCHVDLYSAPEAVVAEAEKARVWTLAVTNAPSVFFHTRDLCRGRTFVQPAIGLHPELVSSHGRELETMWEHFGETRYVGEIGLDYVTADKAVRRKQQECFNSILERSARNANKVLTVHSRRASADVVAAIGGHFPGTVILHWFSGPLKDLRAAVDYGFYFSVNPAMMRSESGRRLAAEMPRSQVLTETDGPFVKISSRPAQPGDVAVVVSSLAEMWRITTEEASRTVTDNLRRALGEG